MLLLERIKDFWLRFTTNTEFMVAVLVTALVFAVLYYYMIKFLSENNAQDLVWIFVIVMIIGAAIVSIINTVNNSVYLLIPAIFVIIIITLFSVELKRLIWAKRNAKLFDVRKTEGMKYDEEKIQHCITEIIKALQNMSKNDVGAIIVLSTGNVPSQIIDSGVKLDSDISADLIESVFFPKTPLHDGAMIINGAKIVAAGCFLPLSQNIDSFPKELGTRHRAGIGVTETIDVISLIVSEETGIISIARGGKITRYADTESLKNILGKYYWQEL
ncbi:MAG: DNA integrity scanning protein DisA nucleotide-binding domain protein [Clostridia bacterium]|nr:DNA integrity scanning protein DisA nucleotide-binding domain protein [Clostridia bacterium]